MRWVLVFCAACNFQSGRRPADGGPSIDGNTAIDGPAAVDAPPPGDAPAIPLCTTSAQVDDAFPLALPMTCQPWGDPYYGNPNGTITEGGGHLVLDPKHANNAVGCDELNLHAWGDNGVVVELASALTGNNNFTAFQLLGLDRSFTVKNGMLVYSNGNDSVRFAMITYNATAMRWLRMRRGTTDVLAEYSSDGMTWTTLGAAATPNNTMRVNVIAGTGGDPPAGTADFRRLVICNP